MDNNYNDRLDQQFKKLLENAPPLKPDDLALADMQQRLQGPQKKKKRSGLIWWWTWLIPLPFLFSSIYFFTKFENANQKIYDLNLQLTQAQTQEDIPANTPQDAATTVYHYDTVYQTIEKIKYIDRFVDATQKTPQNNYAFPQQTFYSSRLTSAANSFQKALPFEKRSGQYLNAAYASYPLGHPLSQSSTILPPYANWVANTPLNTQGLLALFSPLDFLPPLSVVQKEKLELIDLVEMPESKERVNPLLYAVPTGFSLGAAVAPVLSFGLSDATGFGWAYGINGEILFRKRLRLGLGLQFLDIKYELKDNFSDFPKATPENPQDQTKELYIFLSHLELPVYFRYFLRPDKKFNPFFNVGIVARRALEQEFRYEYINSSGEYDASAFVPSTGFSLASAQAGLGLSYALGRHLHIRTQVLYKHDLQLAEQEYIKLNYVGFDLGAQYTF